MDWSTLNLQTDFVPGVRPAENAAERYHIVVSDGEILTIDSESRWRPLTGDELRWLEIDIIEQHYLGDAGGVPVYAAEADPDADEPEGYTFETLWSFLGTVDEPTFNLIGKAKQIVEWHRDHHFCGECGGETTTSDADRSRKCPTCNNLFYPRISPSIIVLITRGEELLLARNARARGRFYSTLAGFVEPGESLEEAVHREVKEEVGVDITGVTYFASQSWPFPNSLMLGFHAEYAGGDFVLQEEEIAEAGWFHYRDLPPHPGPVSIAGRLIQDYIGRLENRR